LQKEERFPDVRAFGVALGPFVGAQWTKFFTSQPIRAHVLSEEHRVQPPNVGGVKRGVSETIDRKSVPSAPPAAGSRQGGKVVVATASGRRRKIVGVGVALGALSLGLVGLFSWVPEGERAEARGRTGTEMPSGAVVERDTVPPEVPSLVSDETKHLPLSPPPTGSPTESMPEESVPSKLVETSVSIAPRFHEAAGTERSSGGRKLRKVHQRSRAKSGPSPERAERTVFGGYLLPPTP
jgi:hypothetical protein